MLIIDNENKKLLVNAKERQEMSSLPKQDNEG
jgi:hypothetical protein